MIDGLLHSLTIVVAVFKRDASIQINRCSNINRSRSPTVSVIVRTHHDEFDVGMNAEHAVCFSLLGPKRLTPSLISQRQIHSQDSLYMGNMDPTDETDSSNLPYHRLWKPTTARWLVAVFGLALAYAVRLLRSASLPRLTLLNTLPKMAGSISKVSWA